MITEKQEKSKNQTALKGSKVLRGREGDGGKRYTHTHTHACTEGQCAPVHVRPPLYQRRGPEDEQNHPLCLPPLAGSQFPCRQPQICDVNLSVRRLCVYPPQQSLNAAFVEPVKWAGCQEPPEELTECKVKKTAFFLFNAKTPTEKQQRALNSLPYKHATYVHKKQVIWPQPEPEIETCWAAAPPTHVVK